MITGDSITFKTLTKAFADDGTGSGNFITAGGVTAVPHGLGYAPTKQAILWIGCECVDNAGFDNTQAFALVSIDTTNINIKASKTIANTGAAGARSVTARIQILLDRENGARPQLT